MELIFFPLLFLVFIGVIMNNAQANNLQTTPTITGYPCIIGVGNCSLIAHPINPTGCQASLDNCNISKVNSISFLNANSPFTLLLEGNLVGFFNCLTGCPTIVPTTNLIFLSACTNFIGTSGDNNFITSLYCGGASFNSNSNIPVAPYNATSGIGNNSNWFIQGITPPNIAIYGEYKPNGTQFQNKYCDAVGLCYYTPLFTCPTTHAAPYNQTNIQYCLVYVLLSSSAPNFNNTFSVFSFVGGIFLLLVGLGLTIAAQFLSSGATIGVNSQATKFAQVFGFALLAWGFIYSEFGSWLSALPINLGNIAFIILTIIFFMGMYWRVFSIE